MAGRQIIDPWGDDAGYREWAASFNKGPIVDTLMDPEEEPYKNDLLASFGIGANSLVSTIGSGYGLITGETDNALTRLGESGQDYWKQYKTPELAQKQEALQQYIDQGNGFWEQLGRSVWGTVSDGDLLANFLVEQVPMTAATGGVGRGVGAAAGALGYGATTATTAGTAAAIGSGAALQGSDIGASLTKELLNMPDKVWDTNEDFLTLADEIGRDAAKNQMALDAGRMAGSMAAGISAVSAGVIPSSLEKTIVGGATGSFFQRGAKGAAGEAIQEGVEEGGGQLVSNIVAQSFDQDRSLTQGLGQAIGQGGLLGGLLGGTTAALSPSRNADLDVTGDPRSIQNDLSARAAEIDALTREGLTPNYVLQEMEAALLDDLRQASAAFPSFEFTMSIERAMGAAAGEGGDNLDIASAGASAAASSSSAITFDANLNQQDETPSRQLDPAGSVADAIILNERELRDAQAAGDFDLANQIYQDGVQLRLAQSLYSQAIEQESQGLFDLASRNRVRANGILRQDAGRRAAANEPALLDGEYLPNEPSGLLGGPVSPAIEESPAEAIRRRVEQETQNQPQALPDYRFRMGQPDAAPEPRQNLASARAEDRTSQLPLAYDRLRADLRNSIPADTVTYLGTSGDGFATEKGAAVAMRSRAAAQPEYAWEVAQGENGRFELFGRLRQASPPAESTAIAELDTAIAAAEEQQADKGIAFDESMTPEEYADLILGKAGNAAEQALNDGVDMPDEQAEFSPRRVADIGEARQARDLRNFRNDFMQRVREGASEMQALTDTVREAGAFEGLEVGDSYITTNRSGERFRNRVVGLSVSRVSEADRRGISGFSPISESEIIEGSDGRQYKPILYVETINEDGDVTSSSANMHLLRQTGYQKMGGLRSADDVKLSPRRIDMSFKDVAKRVPELTDAARRFRAGEIDRAEFARVVNQSKPVIPFGFVPQPATEQEMYDALDAGKRDRINVPIADGERVGLRLDIPAYTGSGVWVPTIHARGAQTSHRSVASVSNASFADFSAAALNVADGTKNKSPFAQIKGEFINRSEADTVAIAEEALNSPDWIQVGMDPERAGYFYDRRNPNTKIVSADEVVQIGPLVLAKNAVTESTDDRVMFSPRDESKEGAIGRDYSLDINRKERETGSTKRLDRDTQATLAAEAARLQIPEADAEKLAADILRTKNRYPPSAGWEPLVLSGIKAKENKKKGTVSYSPVWKAIPYGFGGGGKGRGERVLKVADKFTAMIEDIYRRAEAGDKNAQTIISHQTWYRNVTEILRREFGGSADMFADLLGATSPNTPVDTNFKFSVDVMRRFVRGDFDRELAAYDRHVASGTKKAFPNADKIRQASQKLYGMNSENAQKALLDMWRQIKKGTAPKARNFALNLIGQSDLATIDVWAARMVRRAAGMVPGNKMKRIPPPAEKAVAGNWNADVTAITGEFGFGVDVMAEAVKRLARKGINVTAPDLQAIAWFAEKEQWAQNNWTTKTGEGGSFEENFDKLPTERFVSGVSIQQDQEPTDAEMSSGQQRLIDALTADPQVIAARAMPTVGLYAGKRERSFDTEWTVGQGYDPTDAIGKIAELARDNNQWDFFVSRVVKPGEENPNARPGIEMYFRTKEDLDRVRPRLDEIVSKGVDGFTLVVDQRSRADGEYIGVRMQFVPEISARWDEEFRQEMLSEGGLERIIVEKDALLEDIALDLRDSGDVAFVSKVKYDTVVIGRENYDDYIDSGSGAVDSATGSKAWFGRPVREGFERAVARYEGQRGQEREGSVPDVGGGVRQAGEEAAGRSEEGGVRFSGRVRGSDGVLAGARRPYQGDGRQGYTLEGLPTQVTVDGETVEFAGFAPAQKAAEDYTSSRGLSYSPPKKYAKVDPQRASRIADAFEQMEHTPNDPEVVEAYDALIEETIAQYEAIIATGLEVEFIRGDDPYGNPRNAILDVVENNHLYVFSTRDGFGSGEFDPADNPLLRETAFTISGETALANDIFRVVHDYFGHIKTGAGFRADGEENAWRTHSAMYSPLARRALTTETRGQNSWVNFGPNAAFNRTASGAGTIYADQKVGLLPEWAVTEGATDEEVRLSPRRRPQSTTVDSALARIREALAGREGQDLGDAGIKIVLPDAVPRERRGSLAFAIEAARAFQKADNVTLVAFEEGVEGFNGATVGGQIFIDVNAENPYHVVLGHELTHVLKRDYPDLYQQLEELIIPRATAREESARLHGFDIDSEKGREEYVSDVMGNRFGEREFWEEMANQNPKGFRSIARVARSLLEKLADFFRLRSVSSGNGIDDINAIRADLAKVMSKYRDRLAEEAAGPISDDMIPAYMRGPWSRQSGSATQTASSSRTSGMAGGIGPLPNIPPNDFAEENRRIREQDVTLWDRVKQRARRELAPGGLLPKSMFEAKIERDNKLATVEFDTTYYVNGLERAVKGSMGSAFESLSSEDKRRIQASLTGKLDTSLPMPVQEAIVGMRRNIDRLSEKYVEILGEQTQEMMAGLSPAERRLLGALMQSRESGDTAAFDAAKSSYPDGRVDIAIARISSIAEKIGLMNTIQSNVGQYVHRSYRAFDDSNWYKKVPDRVLNDAREYLIGRLEEEWDGATPPFDFEDRANVIINDILKEGTAYESIEGFIKETKLGAKDLSILQRRKEIAPEIRALMGEYEDARVNYAKTTAKMARLIYNQRFLDRVKDVGMGEFLFTEQDRPANMTQIAVTGNKSMEPLNGLYAPRDVAQAFSDMGKTDWGPLMESLIRVNGMVKYGKTVLSPTTQFRNFMSSAFFAISNGHFDMTKTAKSLSVMREYFSKAGEAGKLAYLRKLKDLGVVYDTPYAGEMARLLEDSKLLDLESQEGDGGIRRTLRSAASIATRFYQFGDDFWKIVGFENEKQNLIGTGMDAVAAEKEAANRIRNTYPTYSMVGRGVDTLRRFPLAGTFVSFPAEIIRTSYNMIKIAAEDTKNPSRRDLGIKRLAGMSVASGLFYALQSLTRDMFDVDDEEEEAIKVMSPYWSENSNLAYSGRDEKGRLRYFDLSFLDPYNYFKRPINAALREQPWQDSFVDSARDLILPFLGTDITAGAIFEVLANEKATGGDIRNSADGLIDQARDVVAHIVKTVQPGIFGNLDRLYKAYNKEITSYGKQYTMEDEVAALFGWRVTTFDPKAALGFRSLDIREMAGQASRELNRALSDPNNVGEDGIEEALDRSLAMRERTFNEALTLISAARSSGMSDAEIRQTMKASGIALRDLQSLVVYGEVPPMVIGRDQALSAYRRALGSLGQERARRILERYGIAANTLRSR